MPVAQLDDILSEVRDVQSELLQVRELVGVLVRRERCAETKIEIATRRLTRMEKERDEESEAECEGDSGGGFDKPVEGREGDLRQMVCR